MSSPNDPNHRDNACYRHPDRPSFVLCQRCGRTICPECQTQAPVGVICPECMRAARGTVPRRSAVSRLRGRLGADAPVVTYAIMAVTVLLWIVEQIPVIGSAVSNALLFNALYLTPVAFEPWRLVTVTLVHGSIFHIAFNMLSLWIFGRVLEGAYGRWRFLVLWIATAIGGSLLVTLLNPGAVVIGASGAIFGLFGAYFFVMRELRMNTTSLLVLVGINIVLGFVVPNVAWQAHLGGLVVGLAAGWLLGRDRADALGKRTWGGIALAGLGLVCAVLATVVATALVR